MKKLVHTCFGALLLIMGLLSCNEDYVQPENVLPYINFKFVDSELKASLDAEIEDIEAQIEVIDARVKQIDEAENKSELLEEKDSLNDVKSSLNSTKSELNTKLTDVKNGLAEITSVNDVELDVKSKAQHSFNLNPNDTLSKFEFMIYDVSYHISIRYNLEYQYTENEYRAIADSASVYDTNFVSTSSSCTNCNTKDAILTVNF